MPENKIIPVCIYKDKDQKIPACILLCRCYNENIDLPAAIKAAARYFSTTPKFAVTHEWNTLNTFTDADLDYLVNNPTCLRFGFKIIDKIEAFDTMYVGKSLLDEAE